MKDITEIIEKILIKLAKEEKTICYSDLAKEINKKSNKFSVPEKGQHMGTTLGKILNQICIRYRSKEKPMLGALVVRKDKKIPSKGFFKLAEKLYSIKFETDEEKKIFWQNEIEKIFKEFRN
ncbi:hypothetical protein [Persephonella sp.]